MSPLGWCRRRKEERGRRCCGRGGGSTFFFSSSLPWLAAAGRAIFSLVSVGRYLPRGGGAQQVPLLASGQFSVGCCYGLAEMPLLLASRGGRRALGKAPRAAGKLSTYLTKVPNY